MPKHPLTTHTHELREVWEELFSLYPRLRTTLPADLARAKARLRERHSQADLQSFGEHHIFIFYRIGTLLERHAEPMTMHELGAALCVPLSTATRMVDGLVETGYARRLPDPEDRRIVRVALTDSGKKLFATFNEFFNRRVEEFLRHFTIQERENMIALMQKGVEVLREITSG
jgi:DNA-binding MarR family transcriptional regulator